MQHEVIGLGGSALVGCSIVFRDTHRLWKLQNTRTIELLGLACGALGAGSLLFYSVSNGIWPTSVTNAVLFGSSVVNACCNLVRSPSPAVAASPQRSSSTPLPEEVHV